MLRLTSIFQKSLIALTCAALCGCEGEASTNTQSKLPELSAGDAGFVQSLIGNCVMAFPDIAKIEAAATVSKAKLVTDPSMLAMIAPEAKGGRWKTWAVKQGDARYILFIGENAINRKSIKYCGQITEAENVDLVASHLTNLLKAKLEDTIEEAGQRTRLFSFEDAGERRILSILDASAMQMKMINVSVATDWRAK
jgi:hypothetical protein